MKALIEMPREHYDVFTAELDITSREYSILKNNIVAGGPETGPAHRIIEIACEKKEAELLLDAARSLYPAAVPEIKEAIARTQNV